MSEEVAKIVVDVLEAPWRFDAIGLLRLLKKGGGNDE